MGIHGSDSSRTLIHIAAVILVRGDLKRYIVVGQILKLWIKN